MKFVEAIEDLSSKAMSGTPPTKELGTCFVKMADMFRQVELSYTTVVRLY
jgi:hypothetical protein